MKKLLLFLSVVSLALLLVACGSNTLGIIPPVGGGGNSGFSNASLTGNWVFNMGGSGGFDTFFVLGVFTADGNGKITAGLQDVNDDTNGYSPNTTFTGTYTVNPDGRGQILFNYGSNNTSTFRFVLTASGKGLIFEISSSEYASGTLIQQAASIPVVASPQSFVFSVQGFINGAADSTLGQLITSASPSSSSGSLTATLDENNDGNFTAQQALAGTFTMSGNGRGQMAVGTQNFVYYQTSASHLEVLETDTGEALSGTADAQGTGFTTASLTGNYVFAMSGAGPSTPFFTEAGRFTLDGSGGMTAAVEDYNSGDAYSDNVSFTGNTPYTVDANGRFTITFQYSGGATFTLVGWLMDSGHGMVISDDAQSVESGVFRLQTGSFSNSTLNGNFGLGVSGANWSTNSDVEQIAAAKFDGAGNISGTQDYTTGGAATGNASLRGIYSLSANGRATATIGGINYRLYVVDPATVYMISAESANQFTGSAAQQP